MLRFTANQQQAVLGAREAWEISQREMAAKFGDALNTGLVGNAYTLPKDAWGEWDREMVQIQRQEQIVFRDLASSVSRPMNIGKLVHFFRTVSDSSTVNISVDGRSMAPTDRPVFAYHGTPLPIIDSTFSYGWREVQTALTEGESLEPAARANSERRIAEKLESIALDGDASIVIDGNQLYGLRTHPFVNTRTTGVTLNAATGAQWVAEFKAVIDVLHANSFFAPATFYVNYADWFYATVQDYASGYPGKIDAQIRSMMGVGEVIPCHTVAADEIIAVIKQPNVVQVLNGMPMATIPLHRENPHDDYKFRVMAAAAVEIKQDHLGNCGVVYSSN